VTGLDTGTRARRHAIDCGSMAITLSPQRQMPTPSISHQSRQLGGISVLLSAETPIMKTALTLHMGGRMIDCDQSISQALLEPLVFPLPT
jgi:hypothetical protein